jgi:uncharacterized protein (TIGR02996 family)
MTDDERSWVQAILAAPDDDTPRLVYADWLDEHGQPERAAFIRTHIELSRMRLGSTDYAIRGRHLERHARELLGRHRQAWIAGLGVAANRHTYFWFRRGLPTQVWCSIRYFVEHASALMAATPVDRIAFRRVTLRNVTEPASCPDFTRLSGVEFLMDETSSAIVRWFFEAAPLDHLREVVLSTRVVNSLWSGWHTRNAELAGIIARCPSLKNLRRLRLRHAGVGDAGAVALAESAFLDGLEFLDLQDNAFGASAEAALRSRFGNRLCLGMSDRDRFTLDDLGWYVF